MFVTSALLINDGEEIGCLRVLSNGDEHACVLIPCDENHAGVEGCHVPEAAQSSTVANANHASPMGLRDRLDGRLIHLRCFSRVRSPNK